MGILCANASRFIQIKKIKINKNILLLAFLSICYDFSFSFLFIYILFIVRGRGLRREGSSCFYLVVVGVIVDSSSRDEC